MENGFVLFGAGVLAALNPYGIAILPSYIAYLLGGQQRTGLDGLWAGLLMSGGFMLVFTSAGTVSILFADVLGKAASWIAFLIGVFFFIAGIFMFFGKNLFTFHFAGQWEIKKGAKLSFFAYGVAYALGSIGCTLPLFSVLVLSAFRVHGLANGMLHFLLYAVGMALVVILISLASTISQPIVLRLVRSGARWMGKLSGVITFLTGIYLMAYWFPYLTI